MLKFLIANFLVLIFEVDINSVANVEASDFDTFPIRLRRAKLMALWDLGDNVFLPPPYLAAAARVMGYFRVSAVSFSALSSPAFFPVPSAR